MLLAIIYVLIGLTTYLVYSQSQKKLNHYLEFLDKKVSNNISEVTSNTSSLEYLLLVNERFLLDEVNLFVNLKKKFNRDNKKLTILNIKEQENKEVNQLFLKLKISSIPTIYKYNKKQNDFEKIIDFFEIENCTNNEEIIDLIMKIIVEDK